MTNKTVGEAMKNEFLQLNPEIVTLLDNNTIIIIYKDDLFESLYAAFRFNKKIAQYLNKIVIFNFGNTDIEIDKDTTYDNVVDSFDNQMKFQKEYEIGNKILDKINNLSEKNIKESLNEIYALQRLSKLILNIELPTYIQKKLSDKCYSFYRKSYNGEKIEFLPSRVEIPKVKVKKG